jgi:hypothetical protein
MMTLLDASLDVLLQQLLRHEVRVPHDCYVSSVASSSPNNRRVCLKRHGGLMSFSPLQWAVHLETATKLLMVAGYHS